MSITHPHRHAPKIDTNAVWNTAFDDDPGFRHLPVGLAPARTHAPAIGGVPRCQECEVFGHDTSSCPKRARL